MVLVQSEKLHIFKWNNVICYSPYFIHYAKILVSL